MAGNKGFIAGAVLGAGVAGAALAGMGVRWPDARADQELTPPPGATAPRQMPSVGGAPLSFADIIQRVSPAVVSIHATGRARPEQLRQQFGLPPGFGQDGQGGGIDPDDLPQSQSAGSGFFIRSDGYLVTNNHVIEGAEEITVRLSDDREYPARVIGRDESTDLAVLKVDATNLPFVSFATDRPARVGDWVIAVGNPFDLGGTVTAGIVSAYGRTLPRDNANSYPVEYLQVDAPINRGNSGGPTFDTAGRVIGVNTAIFSDLPTGGSVGIGFAIPARLADRVTQQLISNGRFVRGYLGATVQSLTPDYSEGLGLGRDRHGAVVTDLTSGGPAVLGGVRLGDVILTFNGEDVHDNSDLTRRVAGVRSGGAMHLGLSRAGRQMEVTISSGTRPTEAELARSIAGADSQPQPTTSDDTAGKPPEAADIPGVSIAGLSVAPLDASARRRFGLNANAAGLVIVGTERGLRGDAARLRPGDLIIQVNGLAVVDVAALRGAVEGARRTGRTTVALLVQRAGVNSAIGVRVDAAVPATQGPNSR